MDTLETKTVKGIPQRALPWAVLTLDLLFLFSLIWMGMAWWAVHTHWTIRGHILICAWHKHLLIWPAVCLILRAWLGFLEQDRTPPRALGLLRFKFIQRLVLLYVAILLPFMAVDSAIRRLNIEINVAPMLLKTRSNGVERYHDLLLKDPELLWKFEPGSRVYGRAINQFGFREREITVRKAPGVRRVICLGDSVTAQGQPGYSQYLHDKLTNAPPGGERWEAFNMGVYGYSSEQGLRLFERECAAVQPDIVTVGFGRNDHNLAKTPDRSRIAVRASPWMAALYQLLGRRHVGRLILCGLERERMWVGKQGDALVRVSPEEYRENMRLFVQKIRAAGAIPILITAPRRAIPQTYVRNGYARTTGEFEQQHDQYCQIAREVAQQTGAALLDLRNIMAGKDCDGFFAQDAVHFDFYDSEGQMKVGQKDQPGLRRIAAELYGAISNVWVTAHAPADSSFPRR